jgi:ATP-dependent 26S proteasome regulatory subunit
MVEASQYRPPPSTNSQLTSYNRVSAPHGALDPAFLRRIRFVVSFPFPDVAARTEIWRRVFPAATPTVGVDPARLAQLTVVGGNIRNIAVNAAFMAAAAGEPVAMGHLLRAARMELAKLERPFPDAEVRGWI